ncbi:MAG: response regulator transcription factor [Ilumatobacteraceae bacterium]
MTAAVLVVEDDPLIASSLARSLGSKGYDVATAPSVGAATAAVDVRVPDLVLLDLGLPDGDGEEVCRLLARHHPHVPVIVLTARREEADVVIGLEMGAVDYVVKPFRLAELLARVAAQLRFAAGRVDPGGTGDGRAAVVGDVTIDRGARRVHVGDREVALRPKEFDVLERLARDAGVVVTRETLIDDVWDENWWGSTKTLDVHINALRRKLGEEPGGPSRIVTIRGVGYRLDDGSKA